MTLFRTLRRVASAAVVAFAIMFGASYAAAQEPGLKKPPPGFERVAGADDTTKVDANKLVIAAYAVFFMGMFGYLLVIVRKQSEISKSISEVDGRIKVQSK